MAMNDNSRGWFLPWWLWSISNFKTKSRGKRDAIEVNCLKDGNGLVKVGMIDGKQIWEEQYGKIDYYWK